MPIAGPLLGTIIQAQLAANGFLGSHTVPLSQAIGNGVVNSILATAVYTGTSTGFGLGVGSSTGLLIGGVVIGPTVGSLILARMIASGFLGSNTPQMASAIGNAIAVHMLTAMVQGASTVVAAGVGTGIITGVAGPMVGSTIFLQMTAMGLLGSKSQQLAFAIGNGVADAFAITAVNTVIAGIPVGPIPPIFPPIPSVGSDTGKLF